MNMKWIKSALCGLYLCGVAFGYMTALAILVGATTAIAEAVYAAIGRLLGV